ncbi:hypothetical protein SAMN04489712_11749 [Thermomonospora echinospora]|uniref:Uncharacterized protein n=1 Tax=Thermomonospora echinospora TaxID=1992 RepID=A0A1H6DIM0_9ACTN|nr:hypothetical protein [Thermomonospora echinospora]SEG84683.1 hypothetical protein SAMN04489712_11749 [Thermomonospora echinospora]
MHTPDTLEKLHTLRTAVARHDELATRHALACDEPDAPAALTRQQALELLALGEVIARKAAYGRQLVVRSARAAGASWSQIGAALGSSKQAAWEAHHRWIDEQARRDLGDAHLGLTPEEEAAARALAGPPDPAGD